MLDRHRFVLSGLLATALACLVVPFLAQAEFASSAGVVGTPDLAKVHPALQALLDQTTEPVKAWVFFKDKGIGSPREYDEAIQQVASTYNARAIQRRVIRGNNALRDGALFDEHDLAVIPTYIDAVVATGARLHVTSNWVNAVSVYATRPQIEQISALSCVEKLQPVARSAKVAPPVPDGPAQAFPLPEPEGASQTRIDYGIAQAQLAQMNLIALHNAGYTADTVVVGVLDTGFRRSHNAFKYPGHPIDVIAEYDFVDDDGDTSNEPDDPSGQYSHGTKILAVLGGYEPGSYVGGAYNASFILCKTEDTTGEYPAEEDNFVAGLEFIESNGGDMATSSLGYIDWYTQSDLDGLTAVTTVAVNIATANGLHCCTAAGNEYHDSNPSTSHLIAPADAFQVITCGAVNYAGATASFSSDGPSADGRVKPEVLARGVDTKTVMSGSNVFYTSADGTSLSTPLVACAVACLIQAHPYWTVDQLRDALFQTADYYVANGTFDATYVRGYGIVNAFAAYQDCTANGISDECDIDCGEPNGPCDVPGCGGSVDCNANGIPDECDIAADPDQDANDNGILDQCERGDCDDDGDVDLYDFLSFQACYSGPDQQFTPGDPCLCGDFDGDLDVDLTDFFGFQSVFTGPG